MAVAVSGGADSVALLCVLKALEDELGIRVAAAHMDHMIRGEQSRKEREFVTALAGRLGVPCFADARDVPAAKARDGLSLQDAARNVRYAFLREALEALDADRIAVGHHADDQVETVLMWFIRGAFLKGLSGIPPVREKVFIRPFIEVTRAEIEQYLQKNRIEYLGDTSIKETHYLRNDIRHNLLPILREAYNPRIDEAVTRMAGLFRRDDEFLQEMARQAVENCIIDTGAEFCCSIEKIGTYPEALYGRMVLNMISRIRENTRGIAFKHVTAVCALFSTGPVKTVQLPGGLSVRREYDRLIFGNLAKTVFPYVLSYDSLPEAVLIEGAGIKLVFNIIVTADPDKLLQNRAPNTELLNYDRIRFPLCIRSTQPGDRFFPLGMKNSKKLKDFFIDEKISPGERQKIPLLISGDRIACVCGLRIDDRFKLKENSSRVLSVKMIKGIRAPAESPAAG